VHRVQETDLSHLDLNLLVLFEAVMREQLDARVQTSCSGGSEVRLQAGRASKHRFPRAQAHLLLAPRHARRGAEGDSRAGRHSTLTMTLRDMHLAPSALTEAIGLLNFGQPMSSAANVNADGCVATGRDSLRCSPLHGCAPRDLTSESGRDCRLLRVAERLWADGANPQ
jgi:hypothetical protein